MHDVIKFQWVGSRISMEQLFSFTCHSKLGPSVGPANSVAHLSDRKVKKAEKEKVERAEEEIWWEEARNPVLCAAQIRVLENKCARRKEALSTSKKKPLPKKRGTTILCCWNVWDAFWWGEPLMQRTGKIIRRTLGKYEKWGKYANFKSWWAFTPGPGSYIAALGPTWICPSYDHPIILILGSNLTFWLKTNSWVDGPSENVKRDSGLGEEIWSAGHEAAKKSDLLCS